MPELGVSAKARYRDDIAESYLADRTGQRQWRLENKIMTHLLHRIPAGKKVLDVPVGTARFADTCLEQGLELVGIDSSEDMLRIARSELGSRVGLVDLRLGDAMQLDLLEAEFDTVFSVRFLNLIPANEAQRAVREFSRVASRQLILEIRVIRLSIWLWIRDFAALIVSQNPIQTLRSCKCLLLEKKLSAHQENEVLAWFDESGLSIEETHVVKESDRDARSLARPLCIFLLRKS